jgi:acyl-CoA thioester hydrolase
MASEFRPPVHEGTGVDPIQHTETWAVRSYELDSNGHVNNAVYLSWAEETTIRHAEVAGYGKEWARSQGGGWVIRRSEVTYHAPALYGDLVQVSVRVELVRGARGVRRTLIKREQDGRLLAEIVTEWAWVRLSDGRPARVPAQLVEAASAVTAITLAARSGARSLRTAGERPARPASR